MFKKQQTKKIKNQNSSAFANLVMLSSIILLSLVSVIIIK